MMVCEECSLAKPLKGPWPSGWFETGTSAKYKRWTHRKKPEDRRPAVICAAWCSERCRRIHKEKAAQSAGGREALLNSHGQCSTPRCKGESGHIGAHVV